MKVIALFMVVNIWVMDARKSVSVYLGDCCAFIFKVNPIRWNCGIEPTVHFRAMSSRIGLIKLLPF